MELTADQRIFELLKTTSEYDLLKQARLLADISECELFDRTEFEVRDLINTIGGWLSSSP